MIKTMLLFCVMLITFSCSSKNEPTINGGGSSGGGGDPIQENVVNDPSLPPPSMDSGLLAWNGGTTTEPTLVGDTYEIKNANELAWIAAQTGDFSGKTIKLMENINMNDKEFDGITSFAGTLEGNNKIIHNININKPSVNNVGLISTLETDGVIQNLTISEGTVSGAGSVGGIVGKNNGDNTIISNVANYGVAVTSTGNYIGGIIGYNSNNLTIVNTVNSGDVTGSSYLGGIIGFSYKSDVPLTVKVTKVRNAGTVSGSSYIGGIIGITSATTIEDAGNSGTLTGRIGIGGIVGIVLQNPTTIDDSYNYVEITATGGSEETGGIVGAIYHAGANLDINGSYYLTASYSAVGKNANSAPLTDNSTKTTLAEFATQSTFAGWDFTNIWNMGDLHPILK